MLGQLDLELVQWMANNRYSPLTFCLLNPIQSSNYWPFLVTPCQYLSQIWANSPRFNLEQHQSTTINMNVGAIQHTGNIMHDVQHATAKKSINYVIRYTVRDVTSGTSRTNGLLDIIFFRTLKVISKTHLRVANNLMNRPNHLICHLISSPVFPAALLHSLFHLYLHNILWMHTHTHTHTI